MATLLYEAWRLPAYNGLEFGPVSERSDQLRRATDPSAKLLYSFKASTADEAMQRHYDRQGWGIYQPLGFSDELHTEAGAAEQAAYLTRRDSPAT